MSTLELITQALEFEKNESQFKSRNERIIAVREAKRMILAINEVYKKNRDEKLMAIMKRLSVIKIKFEKRLRIR
ncbi:MAG: hypothetical protein BM563_00890 [Bacteroidetes bacterium MedPE-SWsnd-G1]|uniref:Uncharacterized protein n=1 Tax=Urechidicola vernalis TaxID=3075600 RepID=A0ABU2Y6Y6_9FLAO|nr:hypothetical protein [Urechidicola sp. P050]MDT0553457.1 hypothetical protein [Urechidicola sp. P050]OIQ41273.1 MAG: hypothetical protein BM563_00890 [Bacteroidetes bacterium MedPE-SWsnd-G1]